MRVGGWTGWGVLAAAAFWAAAALAEESKAAAPSPEFFRQTLQPLLQKHCFKCHTGSEPEGDVKLDKYGSAAAVAEDSKTWQRVLRMLSRRKMPPAGSPRPSEEELQAVTTWLDATLNKVDRSGPPDPGRVTLRRLNRTEYANTIRDLVGMRFAASADFPADDVGYGFDNIGDVLTLPPLLLEKYLAAAEQIAAQADIRLDPGPPEAEAARQFLRRLGTRAYRRPATDQEIQRLVRLVEQARGQGDSLEAGIRLALRAILVSPHFLFRVELDAEPRGQAAVRLLNEYELASRLSYFLWSSMPDEELFEQAARGTLRQNIEAQTRRMLADAKSQALVENFAGQWLQLRSLDNALPNREQFPAFDDELRRAMRSEAEMFFAAMLREDRNVLEFVDADFTFVNARLAKHYGIAGIEGDDFRRVALTGPAAPEGAAARGGVITQASTLTVTSNPTRTSPVKRGKWILENILGTPPPDVPMLNEGPQAVASGSLRQRTEQHRRDPNCAVCHKEMDPLGFALENFDAVGAWRGHDGQFAIDASGELPDGQAFNGPSELKGILRNSGKQKFARCLTEKMLIYALGRGLEPFDERTVEQITKALAAKEYRFSALVLEIVRSGPFQKRRQIVEK